MKKHLQLHLTALFIVSGLFLTAQKEGQKWYFGGNAGLDFSTTPPTVLSNGMTATYEGSSSMSDVNGNLLFYTDGVSVWDKTHQVMANGTGLHGNSSTTQSALIIKQPGNANLYYIFTLDKEGTANGLGYSIVDMSLSSGTGSVTSKNNFLYTPSTEKLCATRHCNGVDVWIVSHDWNSSTFRSYLLSASGVGMPVTSLAGTYVSGGILTTLGQMKISPNSKKLGLAIHGSPYTSFEVFDFNASTGMVSNAINLGTNFASPYGCEFSSDGTKFYGTEFTGGTVFQWDLCAGSGSAIIASKYSMPVSPSTLLLLGGSMQLAIDGKIYIAMREQQFLGVINSPNNSGASCNYITQGLPIAPGTCSLGLPGFLSNDGRALPPPFTFTVNPTISCNTATFAALPIPVISTNCGASSYSYTGMTWLFGDLLSGSSNTSAATNATHSYPSPGTYTTKLVFTSACTADTLTQIISLVGPTLSVNGKTTVCKGEKTILTAAGAQSYTWSTSATTNTVALTPTANVSYTVNGSSGATHCNASKVVTVTVLPCTWLNEATQDNSLSVYPNPFVNELKIESTDDKQFIIYNYSGSIVCERNTNKGSVTIDLKDYPAGVYFLKIINKEASKTIRLVKSQ